MSEDIYTINDNERIQSFPCQFFRARENPNTGEMLAPVMCPEDEVCSNKCLTCGWNPDVHRARMEKMFGEDAEKMMEYSKEVARNYEYTKRRNNAPVHYKKRRTHGLCDSL